MRRPKISVAPLRKPYAKIHVVKGDAELLIEASSLFEYLTADHQTGAGARRHLARDAVEMLIGAELGIQELEIVAASSTMIHEKDPSMLNPAIGVEQQRADGPNVRDQNLGNKFLEPARLDHLDIVIQKQQDLAIA